MEPSDVTDAVRVGLIGAGAGAAAHVTVALRAERRVLAGAGVSSLADEVPFTTADSDGRR